MDENHFFVFSYGSNLLFERIRNRIKSVEVVQKYNLEGFKLIFNKASEDGSVKANIEETSNYEDTVWGVIHKMHFDEKPVLDKHETLGHGYQLICFRLCINGELKTVHTYIANEDRYRKVGRPYDWYLKYIIAGARQNQFPEPYISCLMLIESDLDKNQERIAKSEEILRLVKNLSD